MSLFTIWREISDHAATNFFYCTVNDLLFIPRLIFCRVATIFLNMTLFYWPWHDCFLINFWQCRAAFFNLDANIFFYHAAANWPNCEHTAIIFFHVAIPFLARLRLFFDAFAANFWPCCRYYLDLYANNFLTLSNFALIMTELLFLTMSQLIFGICVN